MEIWHAGWTADGHPVELTVHALAAGRWALDYEFPAT
jgi:hypothetical protein